MEDLFNMLSSSARLDKSKRKKKPTKHKSTTASTAHTMNQIHSSSRDQRSASDDDDDSVNSRDSLDSSNDRRQPKKKRPKKNHSAAKLAQIHREEIAAFRRRMGIRLSADNKHEVKLGSIADPISSFTDWKRPAWWKGGGSSHFHDKTKNNRDKSNNRIDEDEATIQFRRIQQTVLRNIEHGKWTEPTPIQMQALPSLMDRRDVMGCAPTGSGKSGAFILPLIALSRCSEEVYYGQNGSNGDGGANDGGKKKRGNEKSKPQNSNKKGTDSKPPSLQGHIRSVLLAPTTVLASQLHREIQRLSSGLPGFRCVLLSKSNAGLAASQHLGGHAGVDCLVATPLRLAECLQRGMELRGVRLVVLDEADRLLDAGDGSSGNSDKRREKEEEGGGKGKENDDSDSGDESKEDGDSTDDESEGETNHSKKRAKSSPSPSPGNQGGSASRTFLQQIDAILARVPPSASRALFSATLGPSVRHLSESVLRSPLDITTGKLGGTGGHSAAGGASDTIKQELKFVGKEEGKLLAIRQLVAEGLTPPVLVFLQSKERAQALFGELLYDGICVDVIHAGRSPAQRDLAVQKFRRGETWVLICTDLVARGVDFKGVKLVINYDLPADGVAYVHRIGRTGRAGREGRAVTLFTEGDFGKLRTVANVMRLSGCAVPEWMLTLKKPAAGRGRGRGREESGRPAARREGIDTTPRYDRERRRKEKPGGKHGKQDE